MKAQSNRTCPVAFRLKLEGLARQRKIYGFLGSLRKQGV